MGSRQRNNAELPGVVFLPKSDRDDLPIILSDRAGFSNKLPVTRHRTGTATKENKFVNFSKCKNFLDYLPSKRN